MARLVSLGDIRQAALRRVDYDNTGYFSPSEINDLINQTIGEWYELLIGFGEELYLNSSAINLTAPVSGTLDTFTLPADFFRLRGVDANINGFSFDIEPFNFNERNKYKQFPGWVLGYPAAYRIVGNTGQQGPSNGVKYIKFIPQPTGTSTATVWYYPTPPQLVGDAESLDTAAGWEEFIILHVSAKMLIKQGRDASLMLQLADGEAKRIQASASKVDAAHPERVQIVRSWGNRGRGTGWVAR